MYRAVAQVEPVSLDGVNWAFADAEALGSQWRIRPPEYLP